jgi:hypothetical protein
MDYIKASLKEIGCEGVDWIQLVHDRFQLRGPVELDNKPSCSITTGLFADQMSDYQLPNKNSTSSVIFRSIVKHAK